MKKFLFFSALVLALVSCGSKGNGELVGVYSRAYADPTPFGMVFINRGSFTTGTNDQEANWAMNSQSKTVSVDAFWMDETEITNGEYRQFVMYVRDSIARERLADPAIGGDESFKITQDRQGNEVVPYLNWDKPIPWNKPNEDQKRALDSMFYVGEEAIDLVPQLNAMRLNYRFSVADYKQASEKVNKFNALKNRYDRSVDGLGVTKDSADVMVKKDTVYSVDGGYVNQTIYRPLNSRGDFISEKILNIYPDTLCWIRDFTYAYNEPYMKMYFSHPGYGEYPVVGVSWEQATAFCVWRTRLFNLHQVEAGGPLVQDWRLPIEAEWEYAARGGRDLAMYPWGGNYIRTAKGCFLANFKPLRGNYTDDGYMITSFVAAYPPNDYGLYDMAGNVSEWTSSVYAESTLSFVNDMNPDYQVNVKSNEPDVRRRKVIKGGSWKDIGAYLQCGSRTYEYQQETKSYIGFRCVRSFIEGQKN
ncbi:MAG: SUMF1/EgtB/PvdO family nonheme iron enzyme [Prevotellaceae bacterium]|jgi:gliding motility-associated lipoprotein GldK|nr:SUMF1/EgtB/PvdO family nonheme iron enzyme [Prevotellaceae bacterium]